MLFNEDVSFVIPPKKLAIVFRLARVFFWQLIFFLLAVKISYAASIAPISHIEVKGDKDAAHLSISFSSFPVVSCKILHRPSRLVVSLRNGVEDDKPPKSAVVMRANTLVESMRYAHGPQGPQLIFESKVPFILKNKAIHKQAGQYTLTMDLFRKKENIKLSPRLKHELKQGTQLGHTKKADSKYIFRVMLDPGHGGIDGGARGVTGLLEKNVTLSFAKGLQQVLQKVPGIKVALTRNTDVFVPLAKRVEKAQNFGADLFISIHADTINIATLRGATVYTLSDSASDDVAQALAESQNSVDSLGGVSWEKPKEIRDILIDLTRKETHTFSVVFADKLVANFRNNSVKIIKNPHRYAGFRVLKAPDIPSVLLELGYLSNREDEALFKTFSWSRKTIQAIASAIISFSKYKAQELQPSR